MSIAMIMLPVRMDAASLETTIPFRNQIVREMAAESRSTFGKPLYEGLISDLCGGRIAIASARPMAYADIPNELRNGP